MKVGFFNRLLFVLTALVLLAVSLLFLLFIFDFPFLTFSDVADTIDDLLNNNLIPSLVGMGIGLILSIWLLVLAFKRNKTPKAKPIEYITIGTEGSGQLKVATSTINNMICKNVNEITGVIDSKAKTIISEEKTFVTIGVSVDDGVIIPKVCEEIQTTTKEKIQQLTGLAIEEINVLVNNKV